MCREDEAAAIDLREIAGLRRDRNARAARQSADDRLLHIRGRIDEGAVHLDAMRRRGGPFRQRLARHVADITVAHELNPGPALVLIVERDSLAKENLRIDRRFERGRAAQIGDFDAQMHRPAFDVARRLDLAAQMRGGEVRPRRRQPRSRSDGLSWRARPVAAFEQVEDEPRRLHFGAFRPPRLGARRPGVDVEMCPGFGLLDEAAEKQRRGDRAGEAAAPDYW